MNNKIIISNDLEERVDLGINIFSGIKISVKNGLTEFINTELKNLKNKYSESLPEGYSNSRKLYRSFKIDPTKHRPSSEALWRRVKKGLEFPRVNLFVDLTNFLSVKFQISYGLYDLGKIEGDITAGVGSPGENYEGIRKDIVSLDGKIVLRDSSGPFGNPSSDSLRTSTEVNTNNILQVLFFMKNDPQREVILNETGEIFNKFFNINDTESFFV
ncbi:MAG: phenylalanine--tRNA ligase beta subunit-related protein [Acidobacteriota bacterium]